MAWGLQQSPGTSNTTVETLLEAIAGFFTLPFDTIAVTYVAAGNGAGKVETLTSKQGVTTVQTVTVTYNADNKITNITVA